MVDPMACPPGGFDGQAAPAHVHGGSALHRHRGPPQAHPAGGVGASTPPLPYYTAGVLEDTITNRAVITVALWYT